jgi:hypothetical protein
MEKEWKELRDNKKLNLADEIVFLKERIRKLNDEVIAILTEEEMILRRKVIE